MKTRYHKILSKRSEAMDDRIIEICHLAHGSHIEATKFAISVVGDMSYRRWCYVQDDKRRRRMMGICG